MAEVGSYGFSKRGKKTLIYRNFEYWYHRNDAEGRIVWRCNKNRVFKCKTTIVTDGLRIIELRNEEHTHDGNLSTALARKAVGDMKDRVSTTSSNPSVIRAAVTSQLEPSVQMALPKRATVNRIIRRHRQKILTSDGNETTLPASPIDMNFAMPAVYGNFVLFDSGPGTDRIIILGCTELLDALARASTWLADGTFKVVPLLFFQLYSINFQFVQGINPAGLYCLLPNKTRETYDRVLIEVLRLIPTAAPSVILTDFEIAAMTAFKASFPLARITGCYFHLFRSVIRKVHEVGLKKLYESNDAVREAIRCLSAISHVPTEDVGESFVILADYITMNMPDIAHMDEVLSYFEHTYVRGRRLRGRGDRYAPALFPPELWNQRESAADGMARTTNIVEGWHNGLQGLFQCSHPTMWRFLSGLLNDCGQQKATLFQGVTGTVQPAVKRYQRLKERVTRAVATYGQTEILTYLQAISHLSCS